MAPIWRLAGFYSHVTTSGRLSVEKHPDGIKIIISGCWEVGGSIPSSEEIVEKLSDDLRNRKVCFDAQDLIRWDSVLLTFLMKLINHCREKEIQVDYRGLPAGVQGMLHLAYAVPERAGARRDAELSGILAHIGMATLNVRKEAREFLSFIGEVSLSVGKLFTGRAQFRSVDLALFLQECGAQALPIVTMISVLVGLILAFVGAHQLAVFGAQIYIADLVGIGMAREMGAMMTAIVMAGRTGAAYAAQLGTMQVNQEIDALKTMGFPPMEFLVLPRMLALILMMPLLCLYADFLGMFGGALVAIGLFDISFVEYLQETRKMVDVADFAVGIFKSAVFGVLVAVAGCMRGMQCGRSSSAVGFAATSAVVTGIVLIIVSDSVMTILTTQLGI